MLKNKIKISNNKTKKTCTDFCCIKTIAGWLAGIAVVVHSFQWFGFFQLLHWLYHYKQINSYTHKHTLKHSYIKYMYAVVTLHLAGCVEFRKRERFVG